MYPLRQEHKILSTYHNVVRAKYWLSTGVFGKWAATLSLEEGARSHINLFLFGSTMYCAEELHISSITLAFVAHFAQLFFKLPNSLARFKRTASLELGALGSGAFLLLGQLGEWADSAAENRALALQIIKRNRRWILGRKNKVWSVLRVVTWM